MKMNFKFGLGKSDCYILGSKMEIEFHGWYYGWYFGWYLYNFIHISLENYWLLKCFLYTSFNKMVGTMVGTWVGTL